MFKTKTNVEEIENTKNEMQFTTSIATSLSCFSCYKLFDCYYTAAHDKIMELRVLLRNAVKNVHNWCKQFLHLGAGPLSYKVRKSETVQF